MAAVTLAIRRCDTSCSSFRTAGDVAAGMLRLERKAVSALMSSALAAAHPKLLSPITKVATAAVAPAAMVRGAGGHRMPSGTALVFQLAEPGADNQGDGNDHWRRH
ncbi:hypothetical protein [Streptomyces adustus]|uniref:hypothetical protein n=1 Tax=Streptomyces adustus TaxID=1609272 RepID=UPI0037160FA3